MADHVKLIGYHIGKTQHQLTFFLQCNSHGLYSVCLYVFKFLELFNDEVIQLSPLYRGGGGPALFKISCSSQEIKQVIVSEMCRILSSSVLAITALSTKS